MLFRSRDITLNARVTEARFNDSTSSWRLRTADGNNLESRYCVLAAGNLSLPRVQRFPGLETFKGRWFLTGLWPEAPVDFSGRRVGVIGTGSSGIQLIPIVAAGGPPDGLSKNRKL